MVAGSGELVSCHYLGVNPRFTDVHTPWSAKLLAECLELNMRVASDPAGPLQVTSTWKGSHVFTERHTPACSQLPKFQDLGATQTPPILVFLLLHNKLLQNE